jgi:hypothetical protein
VSVCSALWDAAQAFDHPFYGTYAHPLNGANYVRGANFAYAGATANATAFITPFYLNLQVDDCLNFKSKALDTGLYLPDREHRHHLHSLPSISN